MAEVNTTSDYVKSRPISTAVFPAKELSVDIEGNLNVKQGFSVGQKAHLHMVYQCSYGSGTSATLLLLYCWTTFSCGFVHEHSFGGREQLYRRMRRHCSFGRLTVHKSAG